LLFDSYTPVVHQRRRLVARIGRLNYLYENRLDDADRKFAWAGAVVASEVWETRVFLSLVAVSETHHLHGVHLLHLGFLCPGFDLLRPRLFHPAK
jgi:hypothetical protein